MADGPRQRTALDVRNHALRALLAADPSRLSSELEHVTIDTGMVVYDNQAPGLYMLFPVSCLLSLRSRLPDGDSVEVALISDEGMAGLGAIAGRGPVGGPMHLRWVSMRAGTAWRLPARSVLELIDVSVAARTAVMTAYNRLAWEFLVRAQCFRHHHLEAQLSGWLLRYRVLSGSDEMFFTQQELAEVIGVRREGITEALGRLQALGAVSCGRGRLRILNSTVLATRACGCQAVLDDRLSASIMTPVATKTPDRPTALRKAPA